MRRQLLLVQLVVVIALVPAGQSAAHVFVDHTNLTIQAKPAGPVTAGLVTISGKLVGKPACRAGQPIDLINLGTGETLHTTTDAQGRYTFQVTVSQDSAFQAHFGGSRSGTHPHAHVCSASTSRVLTVRVRGSGGSTRDGTTTQSGAGGTGAGAVAADGSDPRATTDAVTATGAEGTAFTGSDLAKIATLAALLLLFGTAAVVLGRRRRTTTSAR